VGTSFITTLYPRKFRVGSGMGRAEEEDRIAEAMEQLRVSYAMRQWRVCSLICESLAEKFRSMAEDEDLRD
jgi:hypothetical protein